MTGGDRFFTSQLFMIVVAGIARIATISSFFIRFGFSQLKSILVSKVNNLKNLKKFLQWKKFNEDSDFRRAFFLPQVKHMVGFP